MKLYTIILSFILIASLGACRDMNSRNRDNRTTQDNTPMGTTTDGRDNLSRDGRSATPGTDRNQDRQNTTTGEMSNRNSDFNQNQILSSNQRSDLHSTLDLTDSQTRQLEELRKNRSGADRNQMDRDYQSVLDNNQYQKYQQWMKDNM